MPINIDLQPLNEDERAWVATASAEGIKSIAPGRLPYDAYVAAASPLIPLMQDEETRGQLECMVAAWQVGCISPVNRDRVSSCPCVREHKTDAKRSQQESNDG